MKANFAHPALRFVAYLVDLGIFSGVWILLMVKITASANVLSLLNNILFVLVFGFLVFPLLSSLLYVFLTANFGGTIGQILTGLSVVDEKNKFLSLKMAFFRNFVGAFVSALIFDLGYLWSLWDKERRGWHDHISESYVVVKNKTGWVLAILALIIISLLNILLAKTAVENMIKHADLYETIMSSLRA